MTRKLAAFAAAMSSARWPRRAFSCLSTTKGCCAAREAMTRSRTRVGVFSRSWLITHMAVQQALRAERGLPSTLDLYQQNRFQRVTLRISVLLQPGIALLDRTGRDSGTRLCVTGPPYVRLPCVPSAPSLRPPSVLLR